MRYLFLIAYPIIDTIFLLESTLRLWRAGFPLQVAFSYARNR